MQKIRSVRLGDQLEQKLECAARKRGISSSEAIREALIGWCRETEELMPLDVLMKDYIGSFDGNGSVVSTDISRSFGEYLEEKKRNGRL